MSNHHHPSLCQVYWELLDALKGHLPVSTVRKIVERIPEVLQMTHREERRQRPQPLPAEDNEGPCPLHLALEHGAAASGNGNGNGNGEEVIKYLVRKCPQALNIQDRRGNLPAHAAVGHGASVEALRAIVAPYPPALRVWNDDRQLPLTRALKLFASPDVDASLAFNRVQYLVDVCPESLGDEDSAGMLAFHVAARSGAPPEVLSLLLGRRPQAMREMTKFGYLPVHYTAESGTLSGFASFRFLVEAWPQSLGLRTWRDELPLHLVLANDCAWRGAVPLSQVVYYILNKRPQAIRSKAGELLLIPLHCALLSSVPHDALGLLLDKWPESIHELSHDGDSILHIVSHSYYNRLGTVRFLVERDESIVDATSTKDGSIPLHRFAGDGSDGWAFDIVCFLVERRPESVMARDNMGCLPLHLAVGNNQVGEITRYLVTQRPETLLETNHAGSLPLHLALDRSVEQVMVQFLVAQSPESLRERDHDGNLPIHIALCRDVEDHSLIRCLVDAYPDSLLERNNEGLSPLHLVVVANRWELPYETARILVQHRPDALAIGNHDGLLPLHIAAQRGDNEKAILQLFLDARPDTAMIPVPADGRLALHCAAATEMSAVGVAKCLVDLGPDAVMIATTDEARRLPLHCALAVNRARNDDDVGDEDEGEEATMDPTLALARVLVEAAPASLQVEDGWGMIPLAVAALNPSTSLDVLWFLMTAWPGSVMTMARGDGG